MKPYKSYPAIKSGWAWFCAAYNLAFFMAPLALSTKILDIWGVPIMLLIFLGVAAAKSPAGG